MCIVHKKHFKIMCQSTNAAYIETINKFKAMTTFKQVNNNCPVCWHKVSSIASLSSLHCTQMNLNQVRDFPFSINRPPNIKPRSIKPSLTDTKSINSQLKSAKATSRKKFTITNFAKPCLPS